MPLFTCPDCGAQISTSAITCPHCGRPVRAREPEPPRWVEEASGAPSGGGGNQRAAVLALVGLLVLLFGGLWLVRQRSPAEVPVNREEARGSEELVDFMEAESADAAADSGRGTYEMSAVDELPQALNREEVAAYVQSNYPPLLRDAGLVGSATVRFRIRPDGTVDPAYTQAVDYTHREFAAVAMRAVEMMRFEPAKLDGKPVPVWADLPVQFQLEM